MKVSAIIPFYNRVDLLKLSVESILGQTHPVSEIILIDDGSTNDTPRLLAEHMEQRPAWRERVRYFRQENQGQAAALNNAIGRATGDWLAFSAHDDLWVPEKLAWQVRALEKFKDQCGMCFTDAWFMHNARMKMTAFQLAGVKHEETLGMVADPLNYVLNVNLNYGVTPVWVQTVMVRADVARRVGGFDPKLRYSEDHDFVFRLACETKFCFVSAPMVLIDRRPAEQRHEGVSRDWHRDEFVFGMEQYRFEKMLRMSEGLSPAVRSIARKRLSAIHSSWATVHLYNDDCAKARQAIRLAAKYCLTPGIAMKSALTFFAPKLARKAIMLREEKRTRSARMVGRALPS